jgi:hypothetical protein
VDLALQIVVSIYLAKRLGFSWNFVVL